MIRLIAPQGNATRMSEGDVWKSRPSTSPWFITGSNGDTRIFAQSYLVGIGISVRGLIPSFSNPPTQTVSRCPQSSLCRKSSKVVTGGIVPCIVGCSSKENERILLPWVVEKPGFIWDVPIVVGGGEILTTWSSNGQGGDLGPVKHLVARLMSDQSVVIISSRGRKGTSNEGRVNLYLLGWCDKVNELVTTSQNHDRLIKKPDHEQCLKWLHNFKVGTVV